MVSSINNLSNDTNKQSNIIYSKCVSSDEVYYNITEYNDIHKGELKKLRKKYKQLVDAFERIATSINRHAIKVINSKYLVLSYEYDEYKLYLQNNTKIVDIERTGECTYEHVLIDDNDSDKVIIFAFKDAQQIKDLFLDNKYYYFKNVFTYKHVPKVEDFKDEDLYLIQNYIGADATKILKKMDHIRYEILKMLYDFTKDKVIYNSSAFILAKHNNKIIFPKVEKHPTLHEYGTIPAPDELYNKLINVNLHDSEKELILKELGKLNKDHNILVMAYALGSLLANVVNYNPLPYLILYGRANCGKTVTANLFSFFSIQADRTTTYQIMKTCQGHGCGYFVLDEPQKLSKDVLQQLKDIATKEKYIRTYGKTGQKYAFKVGGIISANSIYEIQSKNIDDLQGFFRRNLVIKLNENDNLKNVNRTVRFLQSHKKELLKTFIDFLLVQDADQLIEDYLSINISESESQYKFILFSLNLLKKLFDSYDIEFLTDDRINELISRLKETETEFQQDVMKDEDVGEMIEQIIYNDLLKIMHSHDRESHKLQDYAVLNEYSEPLYKSKGYTIYYMKYKKRIAINKTGQQRLIKILNKEYGTNYPEQMSQKFFMEKLREKGINANIKQARISNKVGAVVPRCLFIELEYNEDLNKYIDVLNIIKHNVYRVSSTNNMFLGEIYYDKILEVAKTQNIPKKQVDEAINYLKLKNYLFISDSDGIISFSWSSLCDLVESCTCIEKDDELIKLDEDIINELLTTMQALQNIMGGKAISFKQIKENISNMTDDELFEAINKLKWRGDIDEPKPNYYKVTT